MREGSISPENPIPEKKTYQIAIVENSEHIEHAARDAADKNLTESKDNLTGVKGFFKRIWKHNLFHEYYRQKEISQAKEKINQSGNVYANEGGDKTHHDQAMLAITERFVAEGEELVHTDAGEKKEKFGDNDTERGVKEGIKDLIKDYATGKMNESAFHEEKNRLFSQIRESKKGVIDKGNLYADNVFEVAKQVKQAVEHGERIEALDFDLNVVIGKAKSGARTEAQFNAIDRITEKIQTSKIGRFANEATVASAVAIAYSVGAALSQRIANSKVMAWGTFGATALLGGGIAAARESRRMEMDRKQHFREMAQGKKFNPEKAERRNEMEKVRYETRDAGSLLQSVEDSLFAVNENGERVSKQLTQEEFNAAMGNLAEIESRIKISDIKNIDLISFSDSKNIEQERLALDVSRAQAKVNLRKQLESNSALLQGKNVDEFLGQITQTRMNELLSGEQGIEKKNALFCAMKKKSVAKAAIKGVATGLVVGAIGQEAAALFRDDQTSLVENFLFREAGGADDMHAQVQSYTPLEYARRLVSEKVFGNAEFPKMDMQGAHEFVVGAAHVRLPQGTELVPDAHGGGYHLMRGDEKLADHISFDKNGNLTEAAKNILHEHGIETKQQLAAGSAQEYVDHNKGLMKNIQRKLWYDNDTPAPVFDKNELKLWWGGHNGTGIDSHGNYVFSVKHMMPDGSYHKQFSVDAQEHMKSGNLKIIFSLSRDTQNHVFEVPIDAHGNAHIDPNSEIGKIFFKNSGDHAEFLGKYAEVAEVVGSKNGAEQVRVLATHVGKGIDHVGSPMTDFFVPGKYEDDPPMLIPMFGRAPLEPSQRRNFTDKTREYYYSYGGEGYGLLSRNQYKERMSKSILENKDIDLSKNDSVFINEYLDKQDNSYIDELEYIISNEAPMKKGIEVSITVPAYQEGKNLEKTLRNYAKLNDKEKFEIVLLENHPKSKERDETPQIIEKIRLEFPDLNIVHLYKVFDEKPAIGNVRKYLVDAVLLRKQKAGINNSIAIASNDADLEDISPNYANQVAKTFKNRNVDAMGGKWDFPSDAFKKLPLLHASQRLWQYLDIAFRNYYLKSPELIGRNSAFRSGAYAVVGGYNENAQLAEDLEIGWLIKESRGQDTDRVVYNNAASLVSNPRRAVVKLLSGGNIIQQYGDFHVNEDVRNASLEELLRDKKDFTRAQLSQEVQSIYDHYSNWKKSKNGWIDDVYVNKSFDKAMHFLGVKYRKEGDSILITDTSRLEKGLDKYSKK